MKYKAWANDKKWLPEGPCCQMLNGFPEGDAERTSAQRKCVKIQNT